MGKQTFKNLEKGFYPTKLNRAFRRKQSGKNKKGQNRLTKGWFMTVFPTGRFITFIQWIGNKRVIHVKSTKKRTT